MSRRRVPRALAAAACAVAASGCGEDEKVDAGETRPTLELVGKSAEPVHLAEPSDDARTLYVVERAGRIRAVEPEGEAGDRPFLDVSAEVSTEGEGGLFSVAFDPSYEQNRRLYVAYASRDGRLVVASRRAQPDGRTVSRPGRELLSIPHPNPIHWGGLLAFGPDGELYLGTGEGGPAYPIPSRAQDRDNLLGKLLRLDPDTGAARVVALGLRNPWRYSFDRDTGDLWIGDVGDFTQEEVNHVGLDQLEGANFGWPAREGTAPTKSDLKPNPTDTDPVLTYSRTGRPEETRCAITGGFVVRDPGLPSLAGRYLYGDFCEGDIYSVDATSARPRSTREPTGLTVPRLASFAEDAGGRIYAISLEGPVYRLVAK